MLEPFTPKAIKTIDVLARSREYAAELGHDRAGTGHIMLALIDDEHAPATTILRALDVDTKTLRAEVIRG